MKSLDTKLARIHADPAGCRDFILADAKDADMGFGLAATGKDPTTGKPRSLEDYRDQMRQITRQGLVDVMLMSASTSDQLTIRERLFENSAVTPAVRANDTTDIHLMTGSSFANEPSRPFRTATIEQLLSGKVDPTAEQRRMGADLGLYSITPNNDITFDYATLLAYKDFRVEAEAKGFRHFLEVFDPNACGQHCPADLGRYINDLIVRTLAGVPRSGRPIFLKVVWHGPAAMEELAAYDPHLVPGIMGGSSGTTYDAFKMLEEARSHGARAALYGRKINHSEHQLTFVRFLRAIADAQISAEEAVKAYHGELQKLKIAPYRALKDDLQLTTTSMSYAGTGPAGKLAKRAAVSGEASGGRGAASGVRSAVVASPAAAAMPKTADGTPDFRNMTAEQKVAYARQRIKAELTRNGQ